LILGFEIFYSGVKATSYQQEAVLGGKGFCVGEFSSKRYLVHHYKFKVKSNIPISSKIDCDAQGVYLIPGLQKADRTIDYLNGT